ncbi:NAD(P)-dependent oxidoreductase [Amycolatopsis endophytica]|uniref:3-hydroxyisobutyrate dehydrogenase n=1 Tax=Amycolatopsis endophytica TaxID=860233 RepID=A0A853B710_9PSEU|nr:NAD(P)-dependent oxidoreductase [Amycolatopsis endophytica]NYI91068.1 3-hydroxyisobutyrate dehydrogenase [Amycolatopsis endophytica]
MPETTVAVLGTGIMGLPMAANLAAAGHTVRAWNRTRDKAEPLRDQGCTIADSPAEAVDGADVAVTMLSDGATVDEVMRAASAPAGTLWVQTSTVGPEWTTRLAEFAAGAGLDFVDAPVLGTRKPARDGTLVVLASGAEDLRERCAPVFEAIGGRTMWVGETGAASRLKLVANAWVLALTNGTAESIGLARALGVDPKLFLEAITGGALDVPYAHLKGGAMIDGEYPLAFASRHAAKDARLVLDAAGDGIDLAGTRAALAHLDAAIADGHGDEDMAALIHGVEGPSGR